MQRGQRLISGEGAPTATKVLQFYPSVDLTKVSLLWESDAGRVRPGLCGRDTRVTRVQPLLRRRRRPGVR